jgi:hypothetical protein
MRQIPLKSSKSPEYRAWDNMIQRCYNPNYIRSSNYMDRGITVYDGWRHNFNEFYEYIGDRPTPKHSLDRINNDGDYEPGNVQWATVYEQNHNKRNNKHSWPPYILRIQNKNRYTWIARRYVNKRLLHIGTFNTIEEAINSQKST